jgi:SPP1 family predicted phage head-tail adaptor
MIRAGRLKHRVAIQTQSTTLDSYGEATGSWSTDDTVWAAVEPVNGTEKDIGEGMASVVSHRVIMRYVSGLTSKSRLLFGSRVLGIESVINHEERNEFMKLLCKEVVSE